ncbi:PREDICTED: phytanoyl-CoA dioxygenase, peroxisomal-like isoform X2 [Papilio polytes]|uniref:phytanoyl-CoA dioxygenase, peroxisomal-like isoform X2 n=1 Tax=Papilio polytes TaxID=76194 RepID=UPI000675C825|nr:PREDICTED: phytanoyl-CoA dioxygenase, peroxisomal-like isoform X2 [Papilio polytes]
MDLFVHRKNLVRPKNVNAEETPKYVLSKEQLDYYDKNGFLVIKGLISFECLYTVKKRFLQIVNGLEDVGFMTIIKEPGLAEKGAKGQDVINKINDIHFDEEFSSYSEDPRLLDVVSQLIGESITVVHCMFINKPAGTLRHPPHQDSNKFLFYGVSEEAAAERSRVALPMEPGDTVFFHPLLIHGSGPNVSKSSRKAITCHYASGECRYVSVEGTDQETVAKEVETAAKKKKNLDISFKDSWHYKNKLVRGTKSNL